LEEWMKIYNKIIMMILKKLVEKFIRKEKEGVEGVKKEARRSKFRFLLRIIKKSMMRKMNNYK